MAEERYLSVRELRAVLGISRELAYRVANECAHVRVGSTIRIPQSALDAWIKAHEVPPPPRVAQRMRIAERKRAHATTELDELPVRLTRPRDRKPDQEPFRIRPTRPRD